LGIFINNIFGMSETAGPLLGTLPRNSAKYNLRSCGTPVPGANVIAMSPDSEGNGELCFRSRSCFMGYLKNEQATIEAIDNQRWVHSGDLGRFDQQGNVLITGRLKELIITAGGENIAPVVIEENIKSRLPFLSNVMVVGDRRKFLMAILTMKTSGAP
jgi:long-chain-fatty-acid--CoA ligase ACSBG